jgi:sporulation integral membrane protein YtvI
MAQEKERIEKDKEIVLSIIKYILVAGIALLVMLIGIRVLWLLLPVMIGFVLAYASNLFSQAVYSLFRRKKNTSIQGGQDSRSFRILKLVSYTLLLLFFIGFLILVIFALIAQIRNFINFISGNTISPELIPFLTDRLKDFSQRIGGLLPESTITAINTELTKLQNDFVTILPKIATSALNALLSFVGNMPAILFKIIVIILSGYYFITDRIIIGRFIHSLFPSKSFITKITAVVSKVSSSMFRVLGGYMLILSVTFIEALIGLVIIRMPYAVIFALVITIIDILPAVGASACFFPIAIYMFSQGRIFDGIIALVFIGIIMLVRTFLEPRIIGSAMKLHPLAALIAMILGVAVFGVVGFIGGPILLVLILGIMESFGFEEVIRDWSRKILNKIARSENDADSLILVDPFESRLRHVVMWNLDPNFSDRKKIAVMKKMKRILLSLKKNIPQIRSIQAGSDIKFESTACDFILIVDFASVEDLNIYKEHPAHIQAGQYIRSVVKERFSTDFELL